MRRLGALGLVVCLLVASLAPVFGLAGAVGTQTGPADVAQVGNQEVDSTEFRITVYENTSARWAFVYKTTLENESDREDFRAYADRFNAQETDLYTNFQDRARAVTQRGSDATGRSMNATGFSKQARIDPLTENQGVVRMSFVWTNFAERRDGGVEVGDVFSGGFYIGPDQRLVVGHGPNLRFQAASPQPILDEDSLGESDSLTWLGEREFVDERPRVRLVPPADSTPTPTATPAGSDGSDGGTPTAPPGGGPTGVLPLLGLGVVLLLGLGLGFAYTTGALPGLDDGDGAAAEASAGDGGDAGAAAGGSEPTAGGTGGEAATGAGAGAAGGATEPAVSDEELLEDDERVMRLLDENGGRMKQVNIVEETGWSKSKVSMLLSDMEEDEAISKLRVGRENIISKKGMEPDAAGSPFDDEDDGA
jgi:hypothetical protein